MTDQEKLAAAQALDAAYARADAFDQAQLPTRTVYKVYWDNGGDACGTLEDIFETEAEAAAAAENIQDDALANDVWDEDGYAEAIAVQVPIEPKPEEDTWTELRRTALNHRGEP